MKKNPRVSVIIPAYDEAATLPQVLAALGAQTVPLHEIIVVDNGSTDDTAAVAERLGAHVVTCKKPGPGPARNKGAQHASGEVLWFLDADCVPAPDHLERALKHFGAKKQADLVSGPADFGPAWAHVLSGQRVLYGALGAVGSFLAIGAMAVGANLFIHMEAFRKVGGFREDTDKKCFLEDIALACAVRKKGYRVVYDPHLTVPTSARRLTHEGALRDASVLFVGTILLFAGTQNRCFLFTPRRP